MNDPACISELLKRISEKEATALTELHQVVGNQLFAITLGILKNRQESEDALQEIFLKIWRKADSYSPHLGSPLGWIMTITRNTAFDGYRKRSRQAAQQAYAQQDLTDMATSPQSSADDLLLDAERCREIHQALEALVPDQREAIKLAFFSGHTQQEVSDKLGVPLGTIKARIRRGMQTLKPQLSQSA